MKLFENPRFGNSVKVADFVIFHVRKVIDNLKLMTTFTIGHRFLQILITTDMNLHYGFLANASKKLPSPSHSF